MRRHRIELDSAGHGMDVASHAGTRVNKFTPSPRMLRSVYNTAATTFHAVKGQTRSAFTVDYTKPRYNQEGNLAFRCAGEKTEMELKTDEKRGRGGSAGGKRKFDDERIEYK